MKKIYALALLSNLLIVSCKKEAKTAPTLKKNVVPFTEVGNQMKNEAAIANQPQQKVVTNSVANTAPIQKGMNPAHGQPGHRCDIPVGAPLKSTPAPSAPAPKTQTVQVPANPITTVTNNTEKIVTPEGMNPPHGQENHRCDIAVGAPLPKQ